MSRRNKTYVMTAAILKFEHHFGKAFVCCLVLFLLFPGLRDLIILAVNTAKIAVTEKYISGAVCSAQTRFFAKMCRITRDDRQPAGIARSYFVIEPVVAAIFGTDRARREQFFESLNSLLQFARPQEFQ